MKKLSDKIIDAIPFVIVGAIALIAWGQFTEARHDLETSRTNCYATVGQEACEN